MSTATDIVHAVVAGDFNADGRGDVAIAVDDASMLPVHASLLVYLNNGNNGFAAPTRYPLSGFFPRCLEAVDLNEDGALDLVVCHTQSATAAGLVTVLSGRLTGATPTGTFQQTFSAPVGQAPSAVAGADVDADGRMDLVVVDPVEQRVLLLYGSAGPSAFESPTELAMVAQPVDATVSVAPDLPLPQVLVASSSGGRLHRYTQPTARTFAEPLQQTVALVPRRLEIADLNEDGLDDLVVVSALGAELWYGQASGAFSFGETMADDDALDALVIADLNGDGRLDIAASASDRDQVTVVLNGADVPFTPSPTGTVTQTPTPTMPIATHTPGGCVGDCDGDGLVTVNELVRGVNIALGNAAIDTCRAFDVDGNGQVPVNELIAGVTNALNGCMGTAR